MRFVELRAGGDRPFVLDFHPGITLLAGLGETGREWMGGLLDAALRGELSDLEGVVELHGTPARLTPALIADLALPPDVDVLLRAADLPGARPAAPAAPPPDDAVIELDDEPMRAVRALAAELAEARRGLAHASTSRAETERALAVARAALADADAVDVEALEDTLRFARQRREAAILNLDAAVSAQPSADARAAAAERAARREERARLDERRRALLEALEVPAADPAPVATALAGARHRPDEEAQPVRRAMELAVALEVVRDQRGELAPFTVASEAMLAIARQDLAAARAELEAAQAALAGRRVQPDQAAETERLHAEVLEAEERAERRLPSPGSRKRLDAARAAEAVHLHSLGFETYTGYLISTSAIVSDPDAPRRVQRARAAVEDAETVVDELLGGDLRREHDRLAARELALLEEAAALLGGLPDDLDEVATALRALRHAPDRTSGQRLVDALRAVGVDPAGDAVAAAERWLAEANEAHAGRAAAQAELAAVSDDLASLDGQLAALPAPDAGTEDSDRRLDAARAELAGAQAAEQAAQRALVGAADAANDRRALAQRVDALAGDLDGARGAEDQAAARVGKLEVALAEAEDAAEIRRRARERATAGRNGVIDLTDVDRGSTEVYVLARVAAQRAVGHAGSLPLVVAGALQGLRDDVTEAMLALLVKYSAVVQVVLMSDDPAVEAWARQLGPELASVRRFSLTAQPA